MPILQLPPEIFQNILALVDPEDLAKLPLTCRYFNDFIKDNNALARDMYLRFLDDPPTTNLNFIQELKDIVRLKVVCSSRHLSDGDNARDFIVQELPFVQRTVTRLLANSAPPPRTSKDPQQIRTNRTETFNPSNNATLLENYFSNCLARDCFLKQSTLFVRLRHTRAAPDIAAIGHDITPMGLRQQSAKLHSLYGIAETLKDITDKRRYRFYPPQVSHARQIYALACSKVYDLREYERRDSAWGPFYGGSSDGGLGLRVDWEKTEAILVVLGANLRQKGLSTFEGVENVWGRPFAGVWGQSYIPWTFGRLKKEQEREEELLRGDVDEQELKRREEREELERQDPYGVTGTWLRVVCFLDYSDFFLFNFPQAHTADDPGPRPALDRGEATRLILMKIRVTKVEKTTEPGDDHDWPVVHFEGVSRALDGSWDANADSELKGTARMTKEGEVRWTTYSIYSGEERWKSEGFQLGGVKSARGVIGNWFDKDYNDHGPCGPTAFWKVADHEYTGDDTGMLLSSLLPLIVDQSDEELDFEEEEEEDDTSFSDSDDTSNGHVVGSYTYVPASELPENFFLHDGSQDEEDDEGDDEEDEEGDLTGNPYLDLNEEDLRNYNEARAAEERLEVQYAGLFGAILAARYHIGAGLANDLQNQGIHDDDDDDYSDREV